MTEPVTIGVLTPWSNGFFYGAVIAGVTAEVAAVGGRVVVIQSIEPNRETDEVIPKPDINAASAWAHLDGAVSVISAGPEHLGALHDRGIPVVLVSDVIDGFDVPSAVADNIEGTRVAVEHLIEHGHTRIGFVGNLLQSDLRERFASYLDTLERHGITPDPSIYFDPPNNVVLGGRAIGERILRERPDMTAVFVATDHNAFGLLEVLAENGMSVPDELAVVGFDNAERAAFTTPGLTTVSQPFDRLGALAARLVLRQVAGDDVAGGRHRISSHLAIRQSCGCTTSPDDLLPEELRATGCPIIELTGALGSILLPPSGTESTVQGFRDSVAILSDQISAVLTIGGAAPDASFEAVLADLVPVGTLPEDLRRILAAITQFVSRSSRALPEGTTSTDRAAQAMARIAAVLWNQHARFYLERDRAHQRTRAEQFRIGAELIDLKNGDPLELLWLAETHVEVACLALWTDDSQETVRIESVYDARGIMPDVVGETLAVDRFPPMALINAARTEANEVTFIIPVQIHGNSRGLLSVVGTLDMIAMSAHEAYGYWASLLTVALEQRDLLESVRHSEERLALAFEATLDGMWDWDLTTDTVFYSPRCREMLSITDPAENSLDGWWGAVHPDDLDRLRMVLASGQGEDRQNIELEHRLRSSDGSYRWTLCSARPAGPDGKPANRIVGSLSDIHPRRELEEQLRASATHDAVTGLPNRRLFQDRLRVAVAQARRSGTPFAVLFLDLDGFKVVNDSLGHQVGDHLLVEIGNRLESQLRDVDTAARFGGDEFAVLLSGIDSGDILPAATRVLDALHAPARIDGHELTIGASMGIATSAVAYTSAVDVLRDADIAMYAAKSAERGSLAFFDVEMHAQAKSRLAMHQELRRALEEQQFVLHYQPIVDLPTGEVGGFEALVRWNHPERGLLPPSEFLPVMEETGLIIRLGHWGVREACRQIAAWRAEGHRPVSVSVNVSDREFWHAGLLPHIRACLVEHDVPAELLTLEITESVIMHRPDVAKRLLEDMRAAGLRLHIDDFGTGHSSLQTLHRYPVEALKIDQSFVRDMHQGEQGHEIVTVIVALGRALGLEVVAEGVETLEQLGLLRAAGCHSGQGFLFTRAVEGAEAGSLVDTPYLPEEVAVSREDGCAAGRPAPA